MRKFFWLCLFLGAYLWMAMTGNEQFVLEKGRAIYKYISQWFEDADLDFQLKTQKSAKHKPQRPRRWD